MPNMIVFDVRCLQDVHYRDRGVGRLSANLIRSARRFVPAERKSRLVGIVDPALPALESRFGMHLDDVRAGSYLPDDAGASWFVELSPMTHDPLFIARFLDDQRFFSASVVHDFIPLQSPEQYLGTFAASMDYQAKLRWLSRYDHFFPNSDHTMSELVGLLGVSERRITVSPPPIDPAFLTPAEPRTAPLRHIIVVGGGDRRKNVDCAIGAHAKARIGRAGGLPLLVLGGYPEWWQAALRGLYAREGGTQSQLTFLDYVADEELVALYRDALCLIAPSRAEGFSIPVVEGMSVGTPVLASDIPAHRELVENPDLLFGSEDYLRLGYLMDRVAFDPAFRAGMIEDQSNRWQRFRADEIARRFWASMEAAAAARIAAPLVGGRRPKIAVLAPLPPDRSGVADYTAATFRELGKLAEVHAFTATKSPNLPEGVASVAPLSAVPFLSGQFDRVVSVAGNSHFHLEIFRLLMRYGGACIEHDNRLLGFYYQLIGADHALAIAGQELRRPLGRAELDRWLGDESVLEATFLGEIAARSQPLFVHSRGTARLVRERFGVEATYLPFSVYREWRQDELAPSSRVAARQRLQISPREIVIISLGYVGAAKAPLECIWALEMLRAWRVPAKLYFVGEIVTDFSELKQLCDKLGLTPHVRFISKYVSEADYREYLMAADAAVQLRTHLLGGLSGALLDCITIGLPTVANQDLVESMEAPSYVFPVPDRLSPVLIAEALAAALASTAARRSREAERRAYYEAHSFREYARQLYAGLSLETVRSAAA